MRCALATLVALTTVHALTPGAQSGSGGGPHRVGDTAVTKAIELRVEGVETASTIGGRQARPGYEFVIVDTLWKNIIPLTAVNRKAAASPTGGLTGFGTGRRPPPEPGDVTMESTKYVVSMPGRQFWLFTDDRMGETLNPEAQAATPEHIPVDGFSIAKFEETRRGKLVFEAPAEASYRTFQYYDSQFGHVSFVLSGSGPPAVPATLGPARDSQVLRLALTEASFKESDAAPSGLRQYVVGLRGTSRSPKDIVDVQFQQFVFLVTDQGCVARPQSKPEGLRRPFGPVGSFPPTVANEGQLAFLIPGGTTGVKLLVRPSQGGAIDLPVGKDFVPSWPAPAHTFVDGATMRVHLLPAPARLETLPGPADGHQRVLLDVAVENLSSRQGIEFQAIQLRLALPDGRFADASPLSALVPCRLDSDGVIPAGGVRRFTLVYDVPADVQARVNFRGFELQEAAADLP